MNSSDYVYDQIYKGSLKEGVHEHIAADQATQGINDFNKNKYTGRPSKLIMHRISIAKAFEKKRVK